MPTPLWLTPPGFLGTITERETVSITLETETSSTFSLISGSLPPSLYLESSGAITGSVDAFADDTLSQFVIRATNQDGITDRTFHFELNSVSTVTWRTPSGFISAGIGDSYYVINRTYVDFQFNAGPGIEFELSTTSTTGTNILYLNTLTYVDTGINGQWRVVEGVGLRQNTTVTSVNTSYDIVNAGYPIEISTATVANVHGTINLIDQPLPGKEYQFFLENLQGQIPPGLQLDESGRLHGYVTDQLAVDTRISTGGYDVDQYSAYPYDHGILVNGQYIRMINKFVPKVYQFTVTARDEQVYSSRMFKMLIVDPSNLLADTTLSDASGPLGAQAGYIVLPQWLPFAWQGYTNTNKIIY